MVQRIRGLKEEWWTADIESMHEFRKKRVK